MPWRMTRTSTSRRLAGALAVAALSLSLASSSQASEIVGRNVYGATLRVNRAGTALVQYRVAGGGLRHVLYWNAVDWTAVFRRDYSGGGKSHRANWKHFKDAAHLYPGPPIPLAVAACTTPDGSVWALQRWPR